MAGLAGRRHAEPREGWLKPRTSTSGARRWLRPHGAQQPRAAHLRSAPSRRRADYAQKARGGIWSLSRAVRQIEMHAFKKVQNAARVRLRPWSGWKRRRRTGDRFQFRLPATVSGPEWPLES